MKGHVIINDTNTRNKLAEFDYKEFTSNRVVNIYIDKLTNEEIKEANTENLLISRKIEANMEKGYVLVTEDYLLRPNSGDKFTISYYYRNADVFCEAIK